jgi:phosphomannomutase
MIPWLLIAELLSASKGTLSSMIQSKVDQYPCSGEINREIKNAPKMLERIENFYSDQAVKIDYFDGLSMTFKGWRFNLRSSNTEPVVRLNVEATSGELVELKTEEILGFF